MTATVAIVGRPNVGKSTLFNRIVGQRKALVLDTPGVTRDRNYGRTEWYGRHITVIDTGGFDPDSTSGVFPKMREQALLAVEEADVIIFVCDVREGLTAADEQVYAVLRRARQPVLVAVNKVDGPGQDNLVHELHALGADRLYPVSAEHGRGASELMDAVVELLPEPAAEDGEEDAGGRIRIAVVGRPNAGKSTLINRLLGTERLITSEVPGTTRDAIDTDLDLGDRRYTLVDTAGIRRRRSISEAVEHFGVVKAFAAIERAHVVVLLLDATEGMAEQDARIANAAIERGRALVMAVNKWDLVAKDSRTADQMRRELLERRPSLEIAQMLFMSALTGQRAVKLLELVDEAYRSWECRIPTARLNQWLEEAVRSRPPPQHKHRAVKLYYATQASSRPPTFVIQSNMPPAGISESYRRYLTNQLRSSFDLVGTPVRILVRQRRSRFKGEGAG